MPANYALHRFGTQAMQRLPSQIQRPAQRFRRLYNGGLHGRNFFFYANPYRTTSVSQLYHSGCTMTGAEFFAQSCAWLKEHPSEGGTVCLYGLLAHYCLMSHLAPLMEKAVTKGKLTWTELEVEFDRYLLGLDGKTPPHQQDLSQHLKMTQGECITLSAFFPDATPAAVYRSMKNMMTWCRRMAAPKQGLTSFLLGMTKGEFRQQRMPDHANHKCLHLDIPMLECYEQALDQYEDMAQQLSVFCRNGTPLGEDFSKPFV